MGCSLAVAFVSYSLNGTQQTQLRSTVFVKSKAHYNAVTAKHKQANTQAHTSTHDHTHTNTSTTTVATCLPSRLTPA